MQCFSSRTSSTLVPKLKHHLDQLYPQKPIASNASRPAGVAASEELDLPCPGAMQGLLEKFERLASLPQIAGRKSSNPAFDEWLIRDKSSHNIYQLKVFYKNRLDSNTLQGLMEGIEGYRELEHENIVRLDACRKDAKLVCLVMEYVGRATLYDYMHTKGPLSEQEAYSIFEPLCQAVEHLHSNGIAHTALHAQNVLLTANKQVKLTGLERCKRLKRLV